MGIYITSFVLNMLLGLLLCIKRNGRYDHYELNNNIIKRRFYLLVTAVSLGLICGFRSTKMAYDTGAYKMIFDMCPDTWEHIFDRSSYTEVGFRVLCSIIKIFGGEFQTMLIITSLFVMGSCCIFIYRHSKDVVLSVFIIISFPFFYSSFDIIRHFIATAFVLLGYKYIEEKKLIKFLLFVLMGSLFQTSALIFFPLYFLKKLKWNWKTMSVAGISTMVVFAYIRPVAMWVGKLIGKTFSENSSWVGSYGGGIKTVLMYGAIMLIAFVAFYQLNEKNQDDMTAVNYTVLLFISSIIFINARIMIRVIITAVALLAIAMPQLLDKSRTKSLRDYTILKMAFFAIGLVYHAFMLLTNWQNVVPYIPYWR